MEELERVAKLPNVLGAGVFDLTGECFFHNLKPPYEPILIAEALSQLREVNDNYLVLESNSKVVADTLRFSGGALLVRSFPDMSIAVLTLEQANLRVVSLALIVATLKLNKMMTSSRESVQEGFASLGNGMAKGSRENALSGRGDNPLNMTSSYRGRTGHDSSVHYLGHEEASLKGSVVRASSSLQLPAHWDKGQVSPPGCVGVQTMRFLLKTYLKHMGRDGLRVFEQELSRLGQTPATVRATQFSDLLIKLGSHIPDPRRRSSFVADALGD